MYCLVPARPPGVVVTPPVVEVPAWRSFEFTCVSEDGSRVDAVFKADGSSVEADPRFRVIRYNVSGVRVSAPEGLRDIDDLQIE